MLKTLVTIGALQFVTMLVQLIRTKLLALILGPEMVGAMAVIDKLLAVIAQTVSFSLPFAALRFLPGRWADDASEFTDLFRRMRNLLLALILTATVSALVVTAVRPALWGPQLLPYLPALTAAFFGLPVIALVPFLQNAIAARLQQNRAMMVSFLHALVLTFATVGVWWRGLSGVYYVYAALGVLVMSVVAHRVTSGIGGATTSSTPVFPVAFRLPRPVWRFSGALLILTFASPYAALFVHYRLLRDHGAEMAGWMQAAFGLGLAVRAVLGSAHSIFLTPNVNRGGTVQDRMAWANRFQGTLCLIAGLAVPPLLFFPALAVELLYSRSFTPGAAFVTVFVVTEVVGLLAGTYQSLVLAFDRMRVHLFNNLIAQCLVVALAYKLVGPLGILGAGLAGLVAPLYLYVATSAFLHFAYGLRVPARVVARSFWLLLGLVVAGLTGAMYKETNLESLVLKATIYVSIAGGFALLLTGEERQRLRQGLNRLSTRWT